MEIRRLEKEHYEASRALSQYAFQYELTPEQLEEQREHFRPEEIWGAFEGGKLIAQLTVLDLCIYMNGAALRMGGVAGVSTWPEHRRQGAVAALIDTALQDMKAKGQTVSMLAPFSFGFYRRYGWELYVEYRSYTLEQGMLPRREETAGRVERRTAGECLDWLAPVYDAYASRYNGTLARDGKWWKDSVLRRKKGHAAVYLQADGKPGGYLLYEVKNRQMTLHEFIALNEEARKGLWTFVANHDSMIDKATVTLPSDDALPFLLDNPRIGQELVPYFMARIVDLPAFVAQYLFAAGAGADKLLIQVLDPHAPWNEGTWTLTVSADGTGRLEPCDPAEAHTPDAGCDIQTAAAMLFGYKRPAELRAYGRLNATGEAADRLERLIPRRTTYLADFF